MDFSQHTPNKKVHTTENDQEANASNLMNLTARENICVIIDVTFLRERFLRRQLSIANYHVKKHVKNLLFSPRVYWHGIIR